MYLARLVFFLKLSSFIFSFSSAGAAARNSHRGFPNSIFKRRRVVSNETAVLVGDDQNDLRKRDGTKFVFMHHVSIYWITRWPLSNLSFCDFIDSWKWVPVYLQTAQSWSFFRCPLQTRQFRQLFRHVPSLNLSRLTAIHTPKQIGKMTSNNYSPRECACLAPAFHPRSLIYASLVMLSH